MNNVHASQLSWSVEGRHFIDYHNAETYAQDRAHRENRRVALMQHEPHNAPFVLLYRKPLRMPGELD
jgi:hypothetical protein